MRPSGNDPWVRRWLVALGAMLALCVFVPRADAAGCHLDERPTLGQHAPDAGDPLAILDGPAEPGADIPPALRSVPCSGSAPAPGLDATGTLVPALTETLDSPPAHTVGRVELPSPGLAPRPALARLDRPPRLVMPA